MKKEVVIYPDGSGHAMKKFSAMGVKSLGRIESAHIKIGEDTVIIHADHVSFDGARLTAVLDSMARELVRLGNRLRHFEQQEAAGKVNKKKPG